MDSLFFTLIETYLGMKCRSFALCISKHRETNHVVLVAFLYTTERGASVNMRLYVD